MYLFMGFLFQKRISLCNYDIESDCWLAMDLCIVDAMASANKLFIGPLLGLYL